MSAPRPLRISRRTWLLASAAMAGSLPTARADEPSPAVPAVQTKLDAFAQWVRAQRGSLSAQITDLATGQRVASSEPAHVLNPASNMKLVTAAVALDRLGPNHRFETSLFGKIEAHEIATLVLRGSGDPSLTEADLWRLANALASMGVTRVGTLWVDQTRFDDKFVPPAFEQQPNEWATFRAPVSAIALERNSVTLNVAAEAAGSPARVWFQPTGAVELQGRIETRARGQGQNIQLDLQVAETGLVGKVSGHIAEGLPRQRFGKRVDDPRWIPGLVLKALLLQQGVQVQNLSLGNPGEKQRLTYHASDPLQELLSELGKNSDNFYAEMVFKALASNSATGPATWEQAQNVTRDWLKARNAWTDGTQVANGSGLFNANRLSAENMVKVLEAAYRSPRFQTEYLAQLAIGGVDGTLRSRFKALQETRQVRAKTGTLESVDALSGYVLRKTGAAPFAFSFLVNAIAGQHASSRQQIDEMVSQLANL